MESCEIPRWQQLKHMINNLDPEAFVRDLDQNQDIVLIDVRTKAEVEAYSLPGAINIDYLAHDFLDKLDKLDRQGHYYLYCRTGRRSVRTGVMMKNWGFIHITNMDGGVTALEKLQTDVKNVRSR